MKKFLFVIATTLIATTASAESAFEGFYGQVATGYESNQATNLSSTQTSSQDTLLSVYSGPNQNFGGAPLVIGLGYNFLAAPNWLLGIGADYSALSQKSPTFNQTQSDAFGSNSINGNQLTTSSRFNMFLSPGYAIDKEKLIYLKVGYSSVSLKQAFPNQSAEIDFNTPFHNTSYSVPFSSQTSTLSGYIVGLGYKQMIAAGFYGFAEANYMGYGQKTYTSSFVSNGATFTSSNSPNLSSYQALFGIGYKF